MKNDGCTYDSGHMFCKCGREMIHLGYNFDTGDNTWLCPACNHTTTLGSEI